MRVQEVGAMTLVDKIKSRESQVGVIGLGYVGLPLVIEFCKAGFPVTGFDTDPVKVESLEKRKSYIQHIDISKLAQCPGRFVPTTDFSKLSGMDCIVICVPTPLNKNREPDMSHVFDTTRTIAKHLRKGQLISLESTTYPGTTDEDMRGILEEGGLKASQDFYLAFSPEREDPHNKDFSTSNIPKVVGGYTPQCLEVARALYDAIVVKTIPVSSTKVAESVKLLENIYRAVNIALVNELKMLFDRMGIDVWEVIEAAKTKVEVCPNSAEIDGKDPFTNKNREVLRRYNIPSHTINYILGGNLGKPQGLDFLIDIIQSRKNDLSSYFIIVGNGTEYGWIKKWMDYKKPVNAMLMPGLRQKDYTELVRACDVGLIFLDKRFTVPHFPSRLVSYLENGLPILAATDPSTDLGEIAEKNHFGFSCVNGDLDRFFAHLDWFSKNRSQMAEMGKNGYNFLLKNYTVSQAYNIIMKHFMKP